MEFGELTIEVFLNDRVFRRFAVFDNLQRQNRWRLLAAFAAILLVFSGICFAAGSRAEHAVLLGCILAGVALVVPLIYLHTFSRSVRGQIKRFGLEKPHRVYTIGLTAEPDGVHVRNDREEARYRWDALFGAYRVKGCTYLYVQENRAFLLPDDLIEGGPDALWSLFAKKMPESKLRDIRRRSHRNSDALTAEVFAKHC